MQHAQVSLGLEIRAGEPRHAQVSLGLGRTVCEVEIRNRLPVGALALLVAELVTSPADGARGMDGGGGGGGGAAAAASPLELLQRAVQFARQRGATVPGEESDFVWALPWADR